MDEQQSARSQVNWTGLGLLIVAVGGFWLLRQPLRSSRPEEAAPSTAVTDRQQPESRLWQDPFEAVADYQTQAAHHADGEEDTKHQPTIAWPDFQGKALILPVMVAGSPYVEDRERRVRHRVAVLSALAAAGYVPTRDEGINYLVPQGLPFPEPVPYEWFALDSPQLPSTPVKAPQFGAVLVIWLKDEWIVAAPLTGLATVRREVREVDREKRPNVRDAVKNAPFRVIGPWQSATLAAMVKAATDARANKRGRDVERTPSELEGVELYSASATIDDAFICDGKARERVDPAEGSRAAVAEALKPAVFKNLICTDRVLVGQLLDELRRRGVDPVNGDHVALIAEHDTLYARALPASFTCEVTWRQKELHVEGPPQTVRRFTYLRGIDGKVARSARRAFADQEQAEKAADRDTHSAVDTLDTLERAEGNSQLDYMRRMSSELAERDRVWYQTHATVVKAIGVLGSDVYDKLLVLQALRPRFPDAVFFTTDLDARLWHPRELKWTRNLIVASSYGLQLDRQFQREAPPFRDSYQTALFRAVLEAVDDPAAEANLGRIAAPPPRLFEIGYGGARDLSVEPDEAIHPPRLSGAWYGAGLRGALQGVFFLFLVGVAIWQLAPFPQDLWSSCWRHWPWTFVVLSVLLVYAGVIVYSHYDRRGEPFSLFEGISIWPAEILRLFAAVLGLCSLFCSHVALASVRNELGKKYLLGTSASSQSSAGAESSPSTAAPAGQIPGSPGDATPNTAGPKNWSARLVLWVAYWWDLRCEHSISNWKLDQPGEKDSGGAEVEPVDADDAWNGYCDREKPVYRWLRCIPAAMLYLLALVILARMLGFPSQPHRGRLCGSANLFALTASIGIFILVTAYVIDATRLCTRFVEILVRGPTRWPAPLLRHWRRKLGLGRAYLDEWLDMRLIAALTEVVGGLIWWPVLLLALLIAARNPSLASFDWPPSLWLVFGLNTVFVLWYANSLRRTARAARDVELRRLREKLIAVENEKKGPARRIEGLIGEIENMKSGAFAPLSSQPIIHAVLVAAGGIGIPVVVEYLSAICW
jgi:hypothetical protein